MLDQLLGEILTIIGVCVVAYYPLYAILYALLWLLTVPSRHLERFDRWLKRHAPPQPIYTWKNWVLGYAVLGATFGLVGLILQMTVGLR